MFVGGEAIQAAFSAPPLTPVLLSSPQTRHIHAELEKIGREATNKYQAATKLQVLAERIVDDAISGCIPSRKMLVERLYPALNRYEIAGAKGEAINLRWEAEMQQASEQLREILGGR